MSPARAFGLTVGAFIAAIVVIVLVWFLIGHAIAVVVLVLAAIAFVYRMVLIHRHTRGGQQM